MFIAVQNEGKICCGCNYRNGYSLDIMAHVNMVPFLPQKDLLFYIAVLDLSAFYL